MKENRINKTSYVGAKVWPETKMAFLSKLTDINILTYEPFLAWMIDKWAETETNGMSTVSFNVRTLLSLMPKQTVSIGFKFGDVVTCTKFRYNNIEKRSEWITNLSTIANNSIYKRTSNVIRCLVYAVVLAPFDLLEKVAKEMTGDNIGKTHFASKSFTATVDFKVLEKINKKYNISPRTIARYILDVLMQPENTTKDLILSHFNPNPTGICNKNGLRCDMLVYNDSYRLRVFEFMTEHNIKTRAGLVYSLLDVALKIPQIISPVQIHQGADEDTYEDDIYKEMAIKYYQYTGL